MATNYNSPIRFPRFASDPSGTQEGLVYFNTTENKLKVYSDGNWIDVSGNEIILTAGENITAGDVVYISTGAGNDGARTAGEAYRAQSDIDERIEVIGFAKQTVIASNTLAVAILGLSTQHSGLTTGATQYLSTTPGQLTETTPTTNWLVPVGIAKSSTEIIINPLAGNDAIFLDQAAEISFTGTNNTSTPTDVTGVVYNGANIRSVRIAVSVYRYHAGNFEATENGEIVLTFKTNAAVWTLDAQFEGDDSGTTFSVNSATGQLQYTSTNVAGTQTTYTMKFKEISSFGV